MILMLNKLHLCLYFISISYALDAKCLDDSASYLNLCDEIGRKYEFKAIDATLGSVKGRLKRGVNKTRIGSDRIGLTKPGSDWIGLTKPEPDRQKSDSLKFPPKMVT